MLSNALSVVDSKVSCKVQSGMNGMLRSGLNLPFDWLKENIRGFSKNIWKF